MDTIKISVLMPVYNTAKYLNQSIFSILTQTLKEIELIIVDDGSTDDSLDIIKQWAKRDPRIVFVSQENMGLSISRNICQRKAKGEYIYYMDSDDVLEELALEVCYKKCIKDNLDLVFFDADTFCDDDYLSFPITYDRKGKISSSVNSGINMLDILIDAELYRPSVCLFIVRNEFINRNRLSFVPSLIHEDQIFSAQVYILAERISYIPLTLFHRRVRKDSIMTKRYSMLNIRAYFAVTKNLLLFADRKSPTVRKVIDKLLCQMMDAAIYQANILYLKDRIYTFCICISRYKRYVSLKSYAVLLFPKLITLKSYLKRRRNS